MTELSNNEIYLCGTKRTQMFRASFTQFLNIFDQDTQTIVEEPGKNSFSLAFLKEIMEGAIRNLAELEKVVTSSQALSFPLTPGPVSILSCDPMLDQSQLSQHVMPTYKWYSKLQEQYNHALTILAPVAMKRSAYSSLSNSRKSNKQVSGYQITAAQLEQFSNSITKLLTHLSISIFKPPKNFMEYNYPFVVEVTVSRVLRALLLVRGFVIENIVIKAFSEELKSKETGKYLHDSESRHAVFKKINEHAKCALLCYTVGPEMGYKQFMVWLSHYKNLFSAPCTKCQKHLNNFLPPTWRDYRTYEPFHSSCYRS